ncbi:Uncharacterised protein [Mycobacteroides abscessus subsp. abscessus]|uniref:hypothetical protein n=1 Tax=Mycobacteroides abscessus TaxID=36809 RepID=UPI00092C82B4|nr:hypothetical protein [Mycobacteroides abscessus]SHY52815.1 Uncharacterised protein [Mycobacteroides abscessus subsp. abscessus]SIH55060.1 Uncharacterised protein [Mycobacteroides abscessus subsp. abscessus]SIK80855.1 Uncharacterised protein [Mycobacteroides abscessus subsp. abscessus]
MTAADSTPYVSQLITALDKADAVMDELAATAEADGFDLGPDTDGIEVALIKFFTDPESRDESSAALRASEASW